MIPIEEIRAFVQKELPYVGRGVLMDTFFLIIHDLPRARTYQSFRREWIRYFLDQQRPLLTDDPPRSEVRDRETGRRAGRPTKSEVADRERLEELAMIEKMRCILIHPLSRPEKTEEPARAIMADETSLDVDCIINRIVDKYCEGGIEYLRGMIC